MLPPSRCSSYPQIHMKYSAMSNQNLAIHPSKPIAHVLISFLWKIPARIVSVSTARSSQLKQLLHPLSLHSPTDETDNRHNGADHPASKFPHHRYHQGHTGHKNCPRYLISFSTAEPQHRSCDQKGTWGYSAPQIKDLTSVSNNAWNSLPLKAVTRLV
jgi:hypothetical protein